MDHSDGRSEPKPQVHNAGDLVAELPARVARQDPRNIVSAENHAQPSDLPPNLATAAEQQPAKNEARETSEQIQPSAIAAPMLEQFEKLSATLGPDQPLLTLTQNGFEGPAAQLHEEMLSGRDSATAAHPPPSFYISNKNDSNEYLPPGLRLHDVHHVATDARLLFATPSDSGPPTATPESLRGNPYRLSGSLTIANLEATETSDDAAKLKTLEGQHDEQPVLAETLPKEVDTSQHGPPHDSTMEPESPKQHSIHNKREHQPSDEESSYDEHDCGDDEVNREFRQQLQSHLKPRFQGEQEFRMTPQDPRAAQSQHQPDIQGFGVSGYNQQQRPQSVHPRGLHEQETRVYQGRPYNMQHPTGFQLFRQQARPMDDDFMQGPLHMPPAGPMMSASYQDVARNRQQYAPRGQPTAGYQDPRYAMQSYCRNSTAPGYNYPTMPSQAMQARAPVPHAANHGRSKHVAMPSIPKTQQRGARKLRVVNESDSTDDNEPLCTRVPRQPSVTNDSVMGSSPPAQKSSDHSKQQNHDGDSEPQFVSSIPKLGFKAPKGRKMAPKPAPPTPKSVKPSPTAKSAQTQSTMRKNSSSSAGSIDWKLPEYEAQFEPGATKHDPTVAKVSIPGIVREELILSPDHAEQETHLLLNLFLPTQQALAIPDSAPATAILNFHTVAVMVIEAFVQFEIGDEWGTGRGHWHNNHDEGDADYERLRDAKDADPDEIFFAVIDRWRAGSESNKQPSKLIRGVQEFCDIALDIIHYIKEHGLLKERQRRVRSDKGIKRGAKTVGEDDEAQEEAIKANKSVKRGAGKVNEPAVRKKARVEVKAKSKAKTPAKKQKTSTVGVTVIRKA